MKQYSQRRRKLFRSRRPPATEGAAGSNAKKGGSDELEADESSPPEMAPTEAPNPQPPAKKKRNSHSQEPVEGGGVDLISGLPDAILGDIISLLPTKDGARTQVLACRWRHLWCSAPLNLDRSGLPSDREALEGVVSLILSVHQGPGRRFCVPAGYLEDRPATVDSWLRSPALDNLEEIDFCLPPTSNFHFSATLRVATFSKCRIPDGLAQSLHFPQLNQLGLQECELNAIEMASFGFWNSSSRMPLVLKGCSTQYLGLNVTVIAAPKLEALGCSITQCNVSRLLLGSTEFQELNVVSLTTVLRSVKILAVDTWFTELDMVIGLMECFPCLEKLYIQSCRSVRQNLWRRKHKHFIQNYAMRIKTVVLGSYWGIRAQVNFASFFILNATELEVMRIELKDSDYNERFFLEHHRRLQMEKRASIGARLDFVRRALCRNHLDINHVRDLALTDPFEC
ncbi:unnamed protein product [Urochloa decumbens]|uniref:F-box/LRR-repeat protein 15/At3g58940/PEG3-like LRR domain-containing protein n=1 Tax=Urochloa decumbens TaxID=240449 RepID=A0ABC9G9N7_9POAL